MTRPRRLALGCSEVVTRKGKRCSQLTMRTARIKADPGTTAVYHCVSRVVGGQFLLDDAGKEMLTRLLARLARYHGMQVITYCWMSNHFHLLVRTPGRVELTDAQLLERLEEHLGPRAVMVVVGREALKVQGVIAPDIREALLKRMGDISSFLGELKQRFTCWYNRRNRRFGTLWAERFRSVLVEDVPHPVRTVAAYIDLNPVRAGLVNDPKDYRHCGYAAGLAGDQIIRDGLMSCLEPKAWAEAAAEYRRLLFVTAGVAGQEGKVSLKPEDIRAELARGGRLSAAEMLRFRWRFFTRGIALGSREFLERVLEQNRCRSGRCRPAGQFSVPGLQEFGIRALGGFRARPEDDDRGTGDLMVSEGRLSSAQWSSG